MDIFQLFYDKRNEEQGQAMAKYMRNLFPFLGFKKPERAVISKEFLKIKKRDSEIDWFFIFKCFEMPEREFQYLAIDYMKGVIGLFIQEWQ